MADYLDKDGLDTLIENIKSKDDDLSTEINKSNVSVNNLSERVENLEEAIRELEIVNYIAIYSADDDSLTFYGVADDLMPEENGSFRGKTVTKIYAVPFDDVNGDQFSIPWYENAKNILAVAFDSSFANAKVTSTALWFSFFQNLISIDLRWFDTTHVTSMNNMFYDCRSLKTIDVSWLDTTNVTNMEAMFRQCYSLTEIDVSGFNTAKATTMFMMFYDCTNLATIYSDDDMFVITGSMAQYPDNMMFYGCENLVGGNGTKYSYNSQMDVSAAMAHIDVSENPGYFTSAAIINDASDTSCANAVYGYCSTTADISEKTVSIDDFQLKHGVIVVIAFSYGNIAESPTLNINGTGACDIFGSSYWADGDVIMFTYDSDARRFCRDSNIIEGITVNGEEVGLKNHVAEIEVAMDVPIERITVNDTEQSIEDKTVNIDIPITGINVNSIPAEVTDHVAEITINQPQVYYGSCNSQAGSVEKSVRCGELTELLDGTLLYVDFAYSNIADEPALNVNKLGVYPIYVDGGILSRTLRWGVETKILFFFCDGVWNAIGFPDTYYCSSTTESDVENKRVPLSPFVLRRGTQITVKFDNGNTAESPTLFVEEMGLVPIVGSTNWEAGEYVTFLFDGEQYVVISNTI